jgi:hypothetical protein
VSDRITRIVIAVLVVFVVFAGAIQYFLSRPGPSPSGSPSAARRPPTAGPASPRPDPGAPVSALELNELLIAMDGQPGLVLKSAQAGSILAALEEDQRLIDDFVGPMHQAQLMLHRALTPAQKRYIADHLAAAGPASGPMTGDLSDLLARRSGVADFEQRPFDALMDDARALPAADPGAAENDIHHEDLAAGLLLLEGTPELAISPAQARQILPFVRLQTRFFETHEQTVRKVLALLDPAQSSWIAEAHARNIHRGGRPQGASTDQVIALLRRETTSPGAGRR